MGPGGGLRNFFGALLKTRFFLKGGAQTFGGVFFLPPEGKVFLLPGAPFLKFFSPGLFGTRGGNLFLGFFHPLISPNKKKVFLFPSKKGGGVNLWPPFGPPQKRKGAPKGGRPYFGETFWGPPGRVSPSPPVFKGGVQPPPRRFRFLTIFSPFLAGRHPPAGFSVNPYKRLFGGFGPKVGSNQIPFLRESYLF